MNQPTRRTSARATTIEILQTVVQATLVFVIISAFFGRFVIHQTSMEPNFHEGQRVVVSKLGSLWSELFLSTAHAAGRESQAPITFAPQQIAVFYPSDDHGEDPLIKRVIAVPGDSLEIRSGSVYVNGVLLNEPYIHAEATTCDRVCGPLKLGPDEYFMMGDNRTVSRDSRSFGTVHAKQFVGRVVMRYWPIEQFALYP